jgi:hypothetical protein
MELFGNNYCVIEISIAFLAFLIALLTFRFHFKHKQIEYLQKVHDGYLQNDELIRFFNKIEWASKENPFTKQDLEENGIVAEKLFAHFNFICSLLEKGHVNEHHLYIFKYMLGKFLKHPTIEEYLSYIESHAYDNELPNPYKSLCAYMKMS